MYRVRFVNPQEHVAQMARRLRYNGEDRETSKYHNHGYTALLDNVQAAVLDVKLRYLPGWVEHRRAIAARYIAGLGASFDVVEIHEAIYYYG